MKKYLVTLAAMFAIGANISWADDETNSEFGFVSGSGSSLIGGGSSFSKSVTVTSDGKQTIRTTTITENGVKRVITEVLDADGKVIKREEDPAPAGKDPIQDGPWLGIRVKEITEVLRYQLDIKENEGVEIDVVAPDGPADKAGIVAGDLLLSFAGKPIAKPDDLAAEIESQKVGETIQIGIMKKGRRLSLGVLLTPRPAAKDPVELPDRIRNEAGAGGRAGDGRIELKIDGLDPGMGFDRLLNDPNLPEEFKKTVREMQERMKEFEKR